MPSNPILGITKTEILKNKNFKINPQKIGGNIKWQVKKSQTLLKK